MVEKPSEKKSVQPQARTTTTSFGFRLGKFGLDYREETTVLDPSLSRDVREKKEKARAFETEAEVEGLRAQVGADGARYRETQTTGTASGLPAQSRIKTAMNAYAQATAQILPPPGNMLASVV
nr:hypothetical protein [Pseudodesulfovibrio sp. S3-i]